VIDPLALIGPNCVVCIPTAYHFKNGLQCYNREDAPTLCLVPNRRLLPTTIGRRWLLWSSLPGASRADSNPPPSQNDFLIGQYGHYLIYVDATQADRLPQFEIFVAAAATSSPSPSSGGAAGTPKKTNAVAVPTGILRPGAAQ
jgi:hypothetical protein